MLVHLGSQPPNYLRVCARQVEAVSGVPPVLIGPREGARCSTPKLDAFRREEHLTKMGFGGFWRYTAERFFVLEAWMRANRKDRCLHIESDVLLYPSPSAYERWLSETYGDGLAICPLTDTEDTAAVLYVGSVQALSDLNDAMLDLVRLAPSELIETHGGEMAHEMRMLHVLRTDARLASSLPVSPEHARDIGSPVIFDAGCYGPFIDGWYWEPGVPFVNRKWVVGDALADGRYEISWNAQRTQPVLRDAVGELPLADLHMHSKRLGLWTTPDLTPPGKPAGIPSERRLRARFERAYTRTLQLGSQIRQTLRR